MMTGVLENISIILMVGFIIGLAINILFRIRSVSSIVNSVMNDTLKRDGKWSVTRLTMFSAWITVLWSFHYDIIKNGFDSSAFNVMVGVALGAKITDAISKKLNPEQKPTGDAIT